MNACKKSFYFGAHLCGTIPQNSSGNTLLIKFGWNGLIVLCKGVQVLELKKELKKSKHCMRKLTAIKVLHTTILTFYNLVIFYLLYAALTNKINKWVWIGIGLVLLEAIVLLVFKMKCPLTVVARKYSDSTDDNFDIYLPNWLAKYNKVIYTSIFIIAVLILIYHLCLTGKSGKGK